MSLEQLMSLDVTSVAKEPEPYGEAPAAIDVITGDDIRRSGATSIPEALRLADNLDVAQKNPHDWAISARGFNTALSNKLLVLMDGRSVYTPLFSGVFWDVQNYLLEDLDRIEVISGPGGTLWGANAVNGVINITSKSAKDTQGLYVQEAAGSELHELGGIRYGGTLAPDIYYRVYATYSVRGDGETENGKAATNGWDNGQGGFRIDDLASPDNKVTFQGDYYSGNENLVTGGDARVGGGNLLGRWTHTISDTSDTTLQLYYDRTHLLDPIPKSQFAGAGFLTDDLDTYDLDFQHRFEIGTRNNIVWGFGYRITDDTVQNAPALAFYPVRLDQNLYNVFVQDGIALGDNFVFTLGSKLEHNDYTGWEKEPSARLQWNLTPSQMLWTAVSRAVRTPSRVDIDVFEPNPPPAVLEGSSDFKSETLTAYEVGYRAQLGPKVSASISTYYNDYSDIRSLGYTPVTILPLLFQNSLEATTEGAELGVTWQMLDWWRLHGSYNVLSEDIRVKPGQIDLNNALNETADPKNQVSLRSSMDLPHRIELDADFRWVDKLEINNGGVPAWVAAYGELDLRLGWHATKQLELAIVGQNLLHREHAEYGVPGPLTEEIERSVYAETTWRF